MLNMSKLLLSTVASCFFTFANAASYADPISSASASSSVFDEAGVQKIGQILERNKNILADLFDKDITVVLGDTGAGKSTLINLLAGINLRVNTRGELMTLHEDQGAKIGSGGRSVTKSPYYVNTPDLGIICDLPGFDDTDGAVDDVVNAAFIRQILIGARSVKSIFVTSAAEIEAVRGSAFKRLMSSMKMFCGTDFHEKSSLLVINKQEREEMSMSLTELLSGIRIEEPTPLSTILREDKVAKIIKTRVGDTPEVLAECKNSLIAKIKTLSSLAVPADRLSMTLIFNADTQGILVTFFFNKMKALLQENQKILNQPNKQTAFDGFKSILEQTSFVQLLKPLGLKQYFVSMRSFQTHFDREYELSVQKLLAETTMKEAEEAKRKCLEAELKQKEAAKKELKAQQSLIVLESEKQKALVNAIHFKQEAEEVKKAAVATQAEKDAAIQKFQLAEVARMKVEQEMLQYQLEVQKLDEQRREALKSISGLQETQRHAQERARLSERSFRQKCDELEGKDQAVYQLRSDIQALKEEQRDTRSLRREIEALTSENSRLLSEVSSLREQLSSSSQSSFGYYGSGGGGRVAYVQTPYGLQIVRM